MARSTNWSESEDTILRSRYGKVKAKAIAAEIRATVGTHRTPGSIKARARILRVTKPVHADCVGYSNEEVDFLHENYGRMPVERIIANLHELNPSIKRTTGSVYSKAFSLELSQSVNERNWCSEQDNRIIELSEDYPLESIASRYAKWARVNRYPPRTKNAIALRLNKLGISYNPANCESRLTISQISNILGVSVHSIHRQLAKYKHELKPLRVDQTNITVKKKDFLAWLDNNPIAIHTYVCQDIVDWDLIESIRIDCDPGDRLESVWGIDSSRSKQIHQDAMSRYLTIKQMSALIQRSVSRTREIVIEYNAFLQPLSHAKAFVPVATFLDWIHRDFAKNVLRKSDHVKIEEMRQKHYATIQKLHSS
jgi:hypothetical protein